MKSLIVTVAGLSSRFNQDLEEKKLKCLYYRENYQESLLYQIVSKAERFEEIIIVGGYKYDDLCTFVENELKEYQNRIKLVYNEHFSDYGSGYSLYLGIRAVSEETDEIVFAEGDLYFGADVLEQIADETKNVITINREPIYANKAVVLYLDQAKMIHYLYNTAHGELEIKEPFSAVFNSAQIWKFVDPARLKKLNEGLTETQIQGTNLEVIQKYFDHASEDTYALQIIEKWINCNTVKDYEKMMKNMK